MRSKGPAEDMLKKKAVQPAESTAAVPAHEQVYQILREQILFGEMAPGQAVTIQGLTDALGAGMTPVREAIRRLISDGALIFQGNRRVSVPELSASDITQVIYVRKSIESELCRLATLRISGAEISKMHDIDTELDLAIERGDVPGYLIQNYRFHQCLYHAAGAPILAEVADRLWLRFGPSLRVVCGRLGTQNLPDLHKDILQALRSGDPDAAATAMALDVEQGMEQIAKDLRDSVTQP